MRMKKILFALICALPALSCVREEIKESPADDNAGRKVYASIENIDTKVQLNAERKTVWTENDTIVVMTPEHWSYYRFDGKTGDRNGSFSWLADDEEIVPSDYGVKSPIAIYSYKSARGVGTDNSGNMYIFARVSQVQNYIKGSYGLHANAMYGTSDDGGKTFNFINLFGYLRFSLTGSKAVRRILLWDNTYSYIAGTFYFSPDDPDTMWGYDEFNNFIELDCGEEGVMLSEEPTDFYFALPPFDMAYGLAIYVYFTDGSDFYQMTTNKVSLKRNTIQPMATLSTDGDKDWQYVRIDHEGPYMHTPWLYGKTSMSGFIYYGDDYWNVLDMYSWRHDYEDPQASRQVLIKVYGAERVQFNGITGMKRIDFSEF